MRAPTRRGFAVLVIAGLFVTAVFASALAIIGNVWVVAVVAVAFAAGWATTRFLGEVPQWIRTLVILGAFAGFFALGALAEPVVAVGLTAAIAYFPGCFLTFFVEPARAARWREATSGGVEHGDFPQGHAHRSSGGVDR